MADIPFTGFSPTLGTNSNAPDVGGSVSFNGINQADDAIGKIMRKRGSRALKALMVALTGATTGGTAAATYPRVLEEESTFSHTQFGGLRTIATTTVINRATVEADVTNITAIERRARPPVAYMKSYRETDEPTDGTRVDEPYDALLSASLTATSFILGRSHMIRKP